MITSKITAFWLSLYPSQHFIFIPIILSKSLIRRLRRKSSSPINKEREFKSFRSTKLQTIYIKNNYFSSIVEKKLDKNKGKSHSKQKSQKLCQMAVKTCKQPFLGCLHVRKTLFNNFLNLPHNFEILL